MPRKGQRSYTYHGVRFEWEGGEYVDVTMPGAEYPIDVINVWDYEAGEPTIPRVRTRADRELFVATCRAWYDGLTPAELADYRMASC